MSTTLPVGGAIPIIIPARATNREQVFQGLKAFDLERYTPNAVSPASCLRAALDECFLPRTKDETIIVKQRCHRFTVIAGKLGEDGKPGDEWGKIIATASVNESSEVTLDPYDDEKMSAIRGVMCRVAPWVPSRNVMDSLIELIAAGGGRTLHPAGHIYWLPADKIPGFEAIANVFVRASAKTDGHGKPSRPTSVHQLKVVADLDMVLSVGDAIARDVEAALSGIERDVAEFDLGDRAIQNRIDSAQRLLDQVKAYEEQYKRTLTTLTEQGERTLTSLAVSTMQSVAAAMNKTSDQAANLVA